MKNIFLLLLLSTILLAKYDNCTFKNKDYIDICEKVVKKGVSYKYANKFLLSYFKTKKYDEISWKYLQPRHIKTHKANEKKANNDYTEKKYGVNREIIAAILMKETGLDKIKPTHDAFIVFNTIVVRTDPESSREKWLHKMGKTNMTSIIVHCYKKGVTPEQCNLPSSYAGAIGIPQFMPNSFIYAEGYKNKVADLTNMEDSIVSVAKFLHKKADFSELIDWDKIPAMDKIESQWYEYEFKYDNASFVYEKSKHGTLYNCFTKNKPQLQYLKTYAKKIMRYNNSSNYSVGVMRLAYDSHKLLKR